ncbi:hypothetical protein VFPFJ_01853 [Purpureocillium lilacinum]|uniref:Circumsporozoite protein n=1 Tax=Purpureocillium lilacinum TaxID=33203 RepID=A0A179HS44_PURLI|nr:hypothetical protein VFPFJ_01853 [Purpureocillium lilacinum]KAK4093896.1 hypothetical protein Purlil1_1387 [Purpureocillium lilacinum]OAQ71625.1 hypothetical protein VFPBJ_10404 [Purpureocillium lilacinum]OAQ92692.1 hypothetical protein VFPFJ_01853 [Purpureocillium lilacinum]PWI72070.1 hypothetical protein PCL_10693 [Purpureocillium lilacinum]
MSQKTTILFSLLAVATARFGQEQVPVAAVQALSNRGQPGASGTLSGAVPGVLLAAADPCAKLTLADDIVKQLGNTDDVVAAAKGVVAAEQNFNPFVVDKPSICGDASLPATAALRGIVPLVDPAVGGSDVENANSAKSVDQPFNAEGLSVAQVMDAQGFSNFTVKGEAGNQAQNGTGNGDGGNAGNGNTGNTGNGNAGNGNANNGNAGNGNANNGNNAGSCGAGGGNKSNNAGKKSKGKNHKGHGNGNNNNGNGNNGNGNANNGTVNNGNANNGNGNGNGNNGNNNANNGNAGGNNGADFGKCTPTIDFQLGRAGRKADEGTFLPTDALVAQGQQDALNPNIITNRVCDQLTNVCEANDAAKALCRDAQAKIQASGDRSAAAATTFNSLLGF